MFTQNSIQKSKRQKSKKPKLNVQKLETKKYLKKKKREMNHQGGFRSKKIPTYKSIPLKGIVNWVENKNYGKNKVDRKNVNLQNAEVTKMLDTKNEQK